MIHWLIVCGVGGAAGGLAGAVIALVGRESNERRRGGTLDFTRRR